MPRSIDKVWYFQETFFHFSSGVFSNQASLSYQIHGIPVDIFKTRKPNREIPVNILFYIKRICLVTALMLSYFSCESERHICHNTVNNEKSERCSLFLIDGRTNANNPYLLPCLFSIEDKKKCDKKSPVPTRDSIN